ncbi:MAG: oligosaccharide flippase family protein [Candidatus Omnitrophota bacterium]|nr:oligosaccharide flippase family protein [Candidatus Omnitrophota bacterium]
MKKKLIENTLIYSGLQVLQGGALFLLLPIYTRFLTPDDYGIVSVINAMAVFLGVFYLMGLNGAAYRYYFDFKDNQEELKRFLGTIVTFLLGLSLAFTLILLFFGRFILHPFLGNIKYYPYMFFGILGAAFVPLFTIYQSLQQAHHHGRKFGIIKLLNFIVLSLLTVVFIVIFKLKAMGPILAVTLTSVLFFSFALWDMRGRLIFGIDLKYLKKSLAYSLPIIPHSLTGWLAGLVDRLLINKFVSTAAVGIYNIGYLFGGILGFVNCAINQAYGPWFYEEMKKNQTAKVKKFFILAMTLYITLALWVTIFAKEALWIMTKGDFRESWKVVGLLSFGNFFGGYYYFLANQLFFSEKGTRYIAIATISAALLGFLLNLILIQRYGIMGAALAMFFTNLITTLLVGLFAQRLQPVDWDHLLIIKLVLINGAACIFTQFVLLLFALSLGTALTIKVLTVLICTFVNYRLCTNRAGGLGIFNFKEMAQ